MSELAQLVAAKRIIVCCGSGGVGKTTVAAAIALHGAHAGMRTCVVTIDPARRLADALGLDSLSNTPGRIEGDWPGELWALMLDPKGTFDDLVSRYASSEEQAKTIIANPMYRNLSGTLSGTQEYMAMEKLYELHEDESFDLIVVDTPPTRNALDFLDAPRRLTRFLDNRFFKILMTPTRAYLRAVSAATQAFLRTISKVVGAEVVDDAVAFFRAFEGMEEGFKIRANRVLELLGDEATAFVLVASPRRDAISEATFFAEKLQESGIAVDTLVVNRLHPRFVAASPSAPARGGSASNAAVTNRATTDDSTKDRDEAEEGNGRLAVLRSNLASLELVAEREEAHFSELASKIEPAPVIRVPMLPTDVHDIEGLETLSSQLF